MANTIQIKRSSTLNDVPTAGQLVEGELAINTNASNRQLWSKDAGGTVFEITDHDALTNYVANEHIDWTSATQNFSTSGTITGVNVTSGSDPGHTHTAYAASSHTHTFDSLTSKTSGTGNYQTSGDFIADNFEATGLGPNSTPGTDDMYIGGYGLLGDRTGTIYVSNASGAVSLNYGGVHNVNTKLVTTATGVTVTGTIAVSNASGPSLVDEVASSGNPTLIPNRSDDNTGIGWNAADQLSLIAGGIEFLRLTESTNNSCDFLVPIFLEEQVTPNPTNAGYGQLWVKTATPNELYFTDDGGTDFPVGFNIMPIVTISASQNFLRTQIGRMMHKSSGVAINLTTTVDSGIPVGSTWVVHNDDTEDITINTSSTTNYWIEGGSAPAAGNVTVSQGGIVTVYKAGSAEFWIWGSKSAGGGGGISNVVEDTTPQLGGELDVNGFDINGSTGVTLQYNGVDNIVGTSAGMNVLGGATTAFINVQTSSAVSQAQLGWTASGGVTFGSLVHGAVVSITGEDAGGVARTILTADPDSTTELIADTNLELSVTAGADTALLATANGSVALYYNGSISFQTQLRTTGVTSGAQVVSHNGSWRDVGFNVLDTFNFNVSDTLEASHAGMVTGKTNTTVYTLTGPTSSDVDFPVGGVCTVMNLGTSGNYNISDTTTCTMYYLSGSAAPTDIVGTGALAPGGIVTVWRYSTTAIYIWGNGFTP